MALICYCDGFVLVGSVTGQRYWSSLLDLEGCVISYGAWTPNDDKVVYQINLGVGTLWVEYFTENVLLNIKGPDVDVSPWALIVFSIPLKRRYIVVLFLRLKQNV